MSILGGQSWLPILSAGPTHMSWILKCLHYIKAFTANGQTHCGKAALVDLTSCRDLKKKKKKAVKTTIAHQTSGLHTMSQQQAKAHTMHMMCTYCIV